MDAARRGKETSWPKLTGGPVDPLIMMVHETFTTGATRRHAPAETDATGDDMWLTGPMVSHSLITRSADPHGQPEPDWSVSHEETFALDGELLADSRTRDHASR